MLGQTKRTELEEPSGDLYRLRSFSITPSGICNLGDSLRSRRSRSISSVSSSCSSHSGVAQSDRDRVPRWVSCYVIYPLYSSPLQDSYNESNIHCLDLSTPPIVKPLDLKSKSLCSLLLLYCQRINDRYFNTSNRQYVIHPQTTCSSGGQLNMVQERKDYLFIKIRFYPYSQYNKFFYVSVIFSWQLRFWDKSGVTFQLSSQDK